MENYTGLRIKMFREQIGMSQAELAEKMGYTSKAAISKIETGACGVHPYKAMKFAEALGCRVEDLVDVESLPIVKEARESYEKLHENATELLKFEALQNILGMLSEMDADKIIKIEKVIRTLSED